MHWTVVFVLFSLSKTTLPHTYISIHNVVHCVCFAKYSDEERSQLLSHYLDKGGDHTVDVNEVAGATAGYSSAELALLCRYNIEVF